MANIRLTEQERGLIDTVLWLANLERVKNVKDVEECVMRAGKRLGQCGKPGCAKFNLAWEGRPRRHCNHAHYQASQQLTNAERSRRYRERKSKKEV